MKHGLRIVTFTFAAACALGLGVWSGHHAPASLAVANTAPQLADIGDAWHAMNKRSTNSAARAPTHAPAMQSPPPSLPLGPFGTIADELKRRANAGDARAAKALADGFRRCQYFDPPKDQAALKKRAEDNTVNQLGVVDQTVDQAKEAAAKKGVTLGKLPQINALDAYHQELTAETELAQACKDVVQTDTQAWRIWYGRAAELGDADAEVGYWSVAFRSASLASLDTIAHDKSVASATLQRAMAAGDPRALAAIGEVMQAGYLADPDAFDAHAYYFAASQAPTQDIATLPWIGNGLARLFSGNDTRTYLDRQLQRTAAQLDPQQIAASERLGAQLYEHCCSGVGR